jgi:hypothetical protein
MIFTMVRLEAQSQPPHAMARWGRIAYLGTKPEPCAPGKYQSECGIGSERKALPTKDRSAMHADARGIDSATPLAMTK